jgi:hypothetical protein
VSDEGIVGSFDGLSIRASLGAILLPLAVLVAKLIFDATTGGPGIAPDGEPAPEDIPRALFIIEVGTFFLVPMLALTGAVTAVLFLFASTYAGRPPILRCLFLLFAAGWAMVTAVYYLWVIVPAITVG